MSFSAIMLTKAQLLEGMVMFLWFPLVAMYFRRFKYPTWLDNKQSFHNIPKRYGLNLIRYGFPVILTWTARKMVMNYYQYESK